MRKTLRFAVDLALPPQCAACSARVMEPGLICADCFKEMAFLPARVCGPCGLPLNRDRTRPGCSLCRDNMAPCFSAARAAVEYDGRAREMVLALKHADRADMATAMANLMVRNMPDDPSAYNLIVPVPIHRWRLLKRKFNQAGLIGQAVQTRLRAQGYEKLPLQHALVRAKSTRPQRGSPKARRDNVMAAFALDRVAKVEGAQILLIDDVMTTGHTANECARILLEGGAARVDVLTFARTLV
ncbi:MAG: double zinc ribbon domain-containing protein [Alphaproteobacteria bacterium]